VDTETSRGESKNRNGVMFDDTGKKCSRCGCDDLSEAFSGYGGFFPLVVCDHCGTYVGEGWMKSLGLVRRIDTRDKNTRQVLAELDAMLRTRGDRLGLMWGFSYSGNSENDAPWDQYLDVQMVMLNGPNEGYLVRIESRQSMNDAKPVTHHIAQCKMIGTRLSACEYLMLASEALGI
jgi:hypothetical protein